MTRSLTAGAVYFATVFALGFALGTVRLLLLESRVGLWAATLIELPFMLAASWLLCRWVVERWQISPALGARLHVGAVAFGLLMAAEILIGLTLLDREMPYQIEAMTSGPGALGLAAQLLYASFPVLQMRPEPKR